MRMTAHQQKKRSAIFKQKHESFFGNQILLLFKLDGCFALEKQGTFLSFFIIISLKELLLWQHFYLLLQLHYILIYAIY